jgi:hypothetical protein
LKSAPKGSAPIIIRPRNPSTPDQP